MAKPTSIKELKENAEDVSALLKNLSHANRLMIACTLKEGEKNVSEIAAEIDAPQPHLSRDLGRLRDAGLIKARRESKNVYYSLADDRLSSLVDALCIAFGPKTKQSRKGDRS
ncbi:MAG: transcriptional regulator [Parvularcula sp.]|nr:transcriptional regulator [Parvularcula sp.]